MHSIIASLRECKGSEHPSKSSRFRGQLRYRRKDFPDGAMGFDGVTQRQVELNFVAVATPLAHAAEHPGGFEVENDLLYRPFGDADSIRNVSESG